jgi:hypothetical protein
MCVQCSCTILTIIQLLGLLVKSFMKNILRKFLLRKYYSISVHYKIIKIVVEKDFTKCVFNGIMNI